MFMPGKHAVKRTFYGGIRWDIELSKRLEDPLFLESYGYKVYSQNDEDGIIQEIFKRIGTTDKRFIEFGIQDGLESNCHYLFHKGWSGLWLEGSTNFYERMKKHFSSVMNNGRLKAVNVFITKDNINEIFERAGFVGELDLLSIDIDGNDYHIWDAVGVVNPRVLVIEYNAKFPPDCEWVMPYKADYFWDGSDRQGASLKSFELLGAKKGYALVGTSFNGVNAFFVRQDLAGDKFPLPATSENLYNPARWYTWKSGHPTMRCLADDVDYVNEAVKLTRKQKIKQRIKSSLSFLID